MLRILVLALLFGLTSGLDNGLALTPPMGWLSWERFRCQIDCVNYPNSCISEKLYKDMADMVVKLGLKDVGYEFINIDDCWLAKNRDPHTGKLLPDPERFPSGIKALADYMHDRGLKLGIYGDFGSKTCADYPGSEYHLELDANTFAEWEVDMLKFDGCNSNPKDMDKGYPAMQSYLNKTGRPIVFSCEWPMYTSFHGLKTNYSAVRQTCNLWRNYRDVGDSWGSIASTINFYGQNQLNFNAYTGPGGWADPDMLVVGDFGLSLYQQRAQFGMWAMFSAPLFMSVDLRTISKEALDILKNKEVIAINQDPLGIPAVKLKTSSAISVWRKPLSQGNTALAFFSNFNHGTPTRFSCSLGDYGLKNPRGYNATDLFEGHNMGVFKPSSTVDIIVDPTSIVLIKLVPLK